MRDAAGWRGLTNEPDVVLLEGFHAVKHAIRFGANLLAILTEDKLKLLILAESHASDVVEILRAHAMEVSPADFAQLVGRAHPTGTAALARRRQWEALPPLCADRPSPAVLLENPRNLGNVGAAIRASAGLGASSVLTIGDVDPWHPTVVRGSAGLHFALPVLRINTIAEVAGPLVALDPDGQDIRGVVLPDNAVLTFGSERHGISTEMKDRAELLLAIPMRDRVSSYNLTTSVAMVLYHWALRSPR